MVRDWVRQAHATLEQVTGLEIGETDFTDDRLTRLLHHLSQPTAWQAIEAELGRSIVRVYDLKAQRMRRPFRATLAAVMQVCSSLVTVKTIQRCARSKSWWAHWIRWGCRWD